MSHDSRRLVEAPYCLSSILQTLQRSLLHSLIIELFTQKNLSITHPNRSRPLAISGGVWRRRSEPLHRVPARGNVIQDRRTKHSEIRIVQESISTILELAVPCKLDWKSPALAASLKTVTCCNSFCRLSFIMPDSSRSFGLQLWINCTLWSVNRGSKKWTSWYCSLNSNKWLCYFVTDTIVTVLSLLFDHNQYCNSLSWPVSIRAFKTKASWFLAASCFVFYLPNLTWLHHKQSFVSTVSQSDSIPVPLIPAEICGVISAAASNLDYQKRCVASRCREVSCWIRNYINSPRNYVISRNRIRLH